MRALSNKSVLADQECGNSCNDADGIGALDCQDVGRVRNSFRRHQLHPECF